MGTPNPKPYTYKNILQGGILLSYSGISYVLIGDKTSFLLI